MPEARVFLDTSALFAAVLSSRRIYKWRSRMKTLAEIRAHLVAGQFEFSRHALRRAVERNISEAEIQRGIITLNGGEYVSLSGVWCN